MIFRIPLALFLLFLAGCGNAPKGAQEPASPTEKDVKEPKSPPFSETGCDNTSKDEQEETSPTEKEVAEPKKPTLSQKLIGKWRGTALLDEPRMGLVREFHEIYKCHDIEEILHGLRNQLIFFEFRENGTGRRANPADYKRFFESNWELTPKSATEAKLVVDADGYSGNDIGHFDLVAIDESTFWATVVFPGSDPNAEGDEYIVVTYVLKRIDEFPDLKTVLDRPPIPNK